MKLAIIKHLRESGYDVHECALGSDSKCYYLVSERDDRDYGERNGRHFKAVRETSGGSLEFGATLGFFVTRSALATARVKGLIGDFEDFLVEAGVAHLREMLNGDLSEMPQLDIELHSRSGDEEFAIPITLDPITEQRELRFTILRRLYEMHSAGTKRVSKDALLEDLCTQPNWVDRALVILTEQEFVDGALRGEMKLLPKGYLEAERVALETDTRHKGGSEATQINEAQSAKAVPATGSERGDTMLQHEFDFFVSHASEDKEDFARPLAEGLRAKGLRVWFDEFTLTLGDSLRRSIDRGLARSRFGVVVISPDFMRKEWPQKELDGLVAREIGGVKVILPVWHKITANQIREFSPTLADRLAVSSEKGLESVISEIVRAMEHVPLGEEPLREEGESITGLAAELLTTLIKKCPDGLSSTYYKMPQLLEGFPENAEDEIASASYDLQEHGLIRVRDLINGWMISLDERAYEIVDPQIMGWNPQEDAVTLAKLMLEQDEGSARPLQEQLGWSKRRFNPAQRIVVDIVPEGCVRRAIQPDYVTIGISITPPCRAALGRFVAVSGDR